MINSKIKYTLLIASIAALLLLSGCLDNDTSKTTSIPTETFNIAKSSSSVTSVKDNISINSSHNKSKSSLNLTSSETSSNLTTLTNPISTIQDKSNWCKADEILTVNNKDFTVQGLTTDNNKVPLCYAKSINLETNTTTNYYFSQDGKIKKMDSISISSNGKAYASSNVKIT